MCGAAVLPLAQGAEHVLCTAGSFLILWRSRLRELRNSVALAVARACDGVSRGLRDGWRWFVILEAMHATWVPPLAPDICSFLLPNNGTTRGGLWRGPCTMAFASCCAGSSIDACANAPIKVLHSCHFARFPVCVRLGPRITGVSGYRKSPCTMAPAMQ
jgi:hypothetical protein